MASEERGGSHWIPMESNPELMNKFIHSVGVGPEWGFVDCIGLDPDLLAFVPQPCLGVLLLFPWNESYLERRKKLEEKITEEGQVVSPKVYFMKQVIGNACGTIAVVHAIMNVADKIGLKEGLLKEFLERTKELGPADKGTALESNISIANIHEDVATGGQTEAPESTAAVDHHFIAFARVDDHLYELDGGKKFPINHGPTTEDSFLADTAKVIQDQYIQHEPDSTFSVITFGPFIPDDA